jgi:exonuclease III
LRNVSPVIGQEPTHSKSNKKSCPNYGTNGLKLRAFLYNAQSLKSKINEIECILNSEKPAVAAITETWLSPATPDSLILRQNSAFYNILRSDRNSHGGGVCLITSSSIPSAIVKSESIKDAHELLAVDLNLNYNFIRIITVYRVPASSNSSCENLMHVIEELVECEHPSIVVGDWNMPDATWTCTDDTTFSPATRTITDSFKNMNLTQFVHAPTRGLNTLDLVLSNDDNLLSAIKVIPPIGKSDHYGVSFLIQAALASPSSSFKYNYRESNYQAINHHLATIDWSSELSVLTLQEKYDFLIDALKSLVHQFVPRIRVYSKMGQIPEHLQRLISRTLGLLTIGQTRTSTSQLSLN